MTVAGDLALGDTLARNAAWFADAPAYVADGRILTHGELFALYSAARSPAGRRAVRQRRDVPVSRC